jgi:predicted Na+-dependent transporter
VAAVAGLSLGASTQAVALMALSNMLSFVVFPAVFGSLLGIVITTMRGTTSAAMQVLSNLVGYGMGPLLVGMLSDLYGGGQSLRYAMITIMCLCYPWAAIHLVLAARALAARAAP